MSLQRPNFYELLELDPAILDWATIEVRLNQKISAWQHAKQEGNPNERRQAVENLGLVEQIRSVLQDSEQCSKEANAYQNQLAQASLENSNKLQRQIALLATAGKQCSQSQLNQLVDSWQGIYNKSYLMQELERLDIKLVADADNNASVATGSNRVPEHIVTAIKQRLVILGLNDLYDFLKMSAKTSARELKANAAKMSQSLSSAIKTPENEARKQLAGLSQSIFRDENEKLKYDRYLKVAPLDELKNEFNLVAMNQPISLATVNYLVDQAVSIGVSGTIIRNYILELGVEQGWRFQPNVVESLTQTQSIETNNGNDTVQVSDIATNEAQSDSLSVENVTNGNETEDNSSILYPPAPASVNITQESKGFALSWPKARALGNIEYKVLRCQNSVPRNENDGELIGTTSTTVINDNQVPIGKDWYYGVFTIRDGMASIDCAYSGPHHIIVPQRNFNWLKGIAASILLLSFLGGGAWALTYNYKLNNEVLLQAAQVEASSEQASESADTARKLARQLQTRIGNINSIDSAKEAIEAAEKAVKTATQAADEAAIAALRSQNQLQKTSSVYDKILVPVGNTDAAFDDAVQSDDIAQKAAARAKTAKEIAGEALSDAKVRLTQLVEKKKEQDRLLAQQRAEQSRLAKMERNRRARDAAMRRQRDSQLYAEVIQVTPITVKIPREECKIIRKKPSSMGRIFGAILGGVVGANTNSRNGAQAGVLGGVIIGEEVDKKIDRATSKEECTTVDELVDLFEVQYSYQGRSEYARLEYNPGNRGTKVEIEEIRRAAEEAEAILKES